MTYGEAVNEITTGMETLGYIAYKGKDYTLEENAPKVQDKTFLMRLDGLKSDTFTDDGVNATFKITVEVMFTFADLTKLQTRYNDYSELAKAFFNRDNFPQFLNHIEDPSIKMLDNRFLGIYKVYYGLN